MAHLVRISSYNLCSFYQGQQQLLELCNSHDIIAIQEHWLSESDSDKVINLHVRTENPVIKVCCDMCSRSAEFTSLCYSFNVALDL